MDIRQADMQLRPVAELRPWDKNPRKITPKARANLKAKMLKHGLYKPLITEADGMVIGGNMRLDILTEMNVAKVWCSIVTPKDDAERLEIAISDNESDGSWVKEQLVQLIKHTPIEMPLYSVNMGAPVTLVNLMGGEQEKVSEDEPPEPDTEFYSQPGVIYQLGPHRVMCGDATSEDDVNRLFGPVQADLYLTDPPYNVDYTGKTKDALKIENDKKDAAEFRAFLADAYRCADEHLKSGAAFYIWHADSEGYNFRTAVHDVGWEMKQCLVWVKNSMVLGRQDYQWRHEPCLYGWKGGGVTFLVRRPKTDYRFRVRPAQPQRRTSDYETSQALGLPNRQQHQRRRHCV